MATIDDFRAQLDGIVAGLDGNELELITDQDRQIDFLARLAKVLEASQRVALTALAGLVEEEFPDISSEFLENLGEIDADAEQYAESELGFFIYWRGNERDQITEAAGGDRGTLLALDLLDHILPPPLMTVNHAARLFGGIAAATRRNVIVSKDGTVWGTAQYEQLDIGWAKAVINLIKTYWHNSFYKPFPTRNGLSPIQLKPIKPVEPGEQNSVKIAIIGDWAGGNGLAKGVMQTVNDLEPDYVIHLGDTYYAGTDEEEQKFLLDDWKRYGPAEDGRCFTLNSNHDMYSGARGYFRITLADPMFRAQNKFSYFTLEFGDWLIAGFDSAYFAPSVTFLIGGLGKKKKDPQYEFLQLVKDKGKKTILMCHHNPITAEGEQTRLFGRQSKLWDGVTGVITPDYWYWGHIHLAAVYNDKSAAKGVHGRCVGNSCIPIGTPTGLKNAATVDWFANTVLSVPDEHVVTRNAHRVVNGFSMITLTESGITEEFYNAGSKSPVYTVP